MNIALDHWHIEVSSICTLKCPRCTRAEVPETLLNRSLDLKFFQEQIGAANPSVVACMGVWLIFQVAKHVEVSREFALDESSILSTSILTRKAEPKGSAFFIIVKS